MGDFKNFDSVPVGVGIVRRDRLLDVMYVNPALRAMLGVADTEGRRLEDMWPGEAGEMLARKLRGPCPDDPFPIPIGSGDADRWALLSVQEGEFGGKPVFILWATDISASKEAEARSRAAAQQASALADMKSNFLATMSHEIRTPMQSVYGLLELIGEEKPDARIKSMVEIAKTSASGLLEILNDILDFAKMDTDKMELDLFEVPVRTLVRGINEAMAVKVHGADVQLLDDISPDVPFVIIGDPKRLRQILMNLTGNALKFTKQGNVTIRVRLGSGQVQPRAGGIVLRFELADSGIGMSDEVRLKLFQPFTQADSSTSRKYGGTGLGLSICRKLVDIMGGQIGVDSVEGQGSTFWFEIPSVEVSTQAVAHDLPKLDGLSVLSVEDHPQGAKEILRSLESMGARVESCSTYREALDLVRRRPFDVGVIDQGLPDGLGLDLIREIMAVRPFMGLVMYTVRDDIGLQHSLSAVGVTYLSKPASRRGLGEAVQDAARRTARVDSNASAGRLLIAEDTESVRKILQRQLEHLGVEADFVTSGRDALAALETGKYGILFSDLHMPDIDGYGLVQIIRGRETNAAARMPVIVLTADVQMGQRQVYMSHGFDECLLKPVSLGQLRRLLIRWGLLAEAVEAGSVAAADPVQSMPALDLAMVRAQFGTFDEGALDMLRMFTTLTAPTLDHLRAALATGDRRVIAEHAHSLKGAARSACCPGLGDAASSLQDAAERSGDCAPLIEATVRAFERARAAIMDAKAD